SSIRLRPIGFVSKKTGSAGSPNESGSFRKSGPPASCDQLGSFRQIGPGRPQTARLGFVSQNPEAPASPDDVGSFREIAPTRPRTDVVGFVSARAAGARSSEPGFVPN